MSVICPNRAALDALPAERRLAVLLESTARGGKVSIGVGAGIMLACLVALCLCVRFPAAYNDVTAGAGILVCAYACLTFSFMWQVQRCFERFRRDELADKAAIPLVLKAAQFNSKDLGGWARTILSKSLRTVTITDTELFKQEDRELLYRVAIPQLHRDQDFCEAAIEVIGKIGDSRGVLVLRRIARGSIWMHSTDRLKRAAERALCQLEDRLAEENAEQTLLRAHAAPWPELLRPARSGSFAPDGVGELLRGQAEVKQDQTDTNARQQQPPTVRT